MTCYVTEDSWAEVGAWVWDNFDEMNGISFLPSADSDHIYEQAPYQDLNKLEYQSLMRQMPKTINFEFEELQDHTTASQELACTAGVCEI
jgi:ribonucleoside-diphosphate reductase alpha chain